MSQLSRVNQYSMQRKRTLQRTVTMTADPVSCEDNDPRDRDCMKQGFTVKKSASVLFKEALILTHRLITKQTTIFEK